MQSYARRPREAALKTHYDNLGYYSPLDRNLFVDMCETVQVTPASPILDVGCGDGRLARRNPDLEVIGVDYNQTRANAANAICADLYEYLENSTDTFGLVVFIEVLEHLEDPLDAVELARRLGPVFATVPIDLPYEAHLQHWPDLEAINQFFQSDRIGEIPQHATLYWSKA